MLAQVYNPSYFLSKDNNLRQKMLVRLYLEEQVESGGSHQ
jgi:hypothetical protein